MSAIYILWLREVKRYFRSPAQIVGALGQPLLYMLALGFGLGPVFEKSGHGSYIQFLAPGVVGMTLLFSGAFSGIGLLWDRQFGFLKETLVAPVPRIHVMIGRTLGGATVATFQGLLVLLACLALGFRPATLAAVPVALATMVLIALLFCAFGSMIGSRLENMQAFPIVMNFLMMPLFFLSGALFPLENLPPALRAVVNVNPLSYGVDGLRSTLSGVAHFGLPLDLAVLAVVAAVFLSLGAYFFSKIQL
jgi:ABC-2 type transport system permease protein